MDGKDEWLKQQMIRTNVRTRSTTFAQDQLTAVPAEMEVYSFIMRVFNYHYDKHNKWSNYRNLAYVYFPVYIL